jgi:hypothetical protein
MFSFIAKELEASTATLQCFSQQLSAFLGHRHAELLAVAAILVANAILVQLLASAIMQLASVVQLLAFVPELLASAVELLAFVSKLQVLAA